MTCRGGFYCHLEHGTHARYSHGCRCAECRYAHTMRARVTNRRKRQVGKHGWVDAAPFIELLGALYRQGEEVNRIAEVCGVGHQTVLALIMGERTRVQAATAERLKLVVEMLP